MNKQESDMGQFAEWESRSRSDWGEPDWDYEGKYMELEKRLRAGGEQQFSQPRRLKHVHPEDAERAATHYESAERNKFLHAVQGHALPDEHEKTRDPSGGQAGGARSRATDWQDFEDYKPGYSGHQTGRPGRGGILSGKNLEREGGKRAMSGRPANRTKNRGQKRSARPRSSRAARTRITSRRSR